MVGLSDVLRFRDQLLPQVLSVREQTCQQAAFSSQQTMRDAPGNTNFQLVCVQANTKAGDPDPPG
jgi:hypothetical protein